jgi:uncharacterized membrane protein
LNIGFWPRHVVRVPPKEKAAGCPAAFPFRNRKRDYIALVVFVVVVVVVVVEPLPATDVFVVVLLSAGIGAFMSGAMASLDIMVPLSTTGALAVLLAALPPQAETRRAAPAIVAMERMLRMKRSP